MVNKDERKGERVKGRKGERTTVEEEKGLRRKDYLENVCVPISGGCVQIHIYCQFQTNIYKYD